MPVGSVWNAFRREKSANPNAPGFVAVDGTSIILTPGSVATPGGILSAAAGPTRAVTAVTGTAPIASSGGLTPDISVADATSLAVGVVKPDNTTVTVAAGGILSAVGTTLQRATLTLTAAQINGMYATPQLIIPAAGAGTLIVLTRWGINAVFGSAAFVAGGSPVLCYTATSPPVSLATNSANSAVLTTFAANQILNVGGALGGAAGDIVLSSIALNAGVYVSNLTAPFTVGTGASVFFWADYYVMPGLS